MATGGWCTPALSSWLPPEGTSLWLLCYSGHSAGSTLLFLLFRSTSLHTQHRRPSLQAHWLSLAAWLWWPVVAEQSTHYWTLIHQTTAPRSPGNSGYSVATVADISECSVLSWSPAHSHVPADPVLCSIMDPGFMDILHLVPFQPSFLNMGPLMRTSSPTLMTGTVPSVHSDPASTALLFE